MICENCSLDHNGNYGSGRFCSEKCARGFASKEKREEINIKISKTLGGPNHIYIPKEQFCLYCGNKLKGNQKKFCSNTCSVEYKYLININKWLLDVFDFSYSIKCPSFIRRYLWEQHDGGCSRCGWKEVNPLLKRPMLEVEHIDGDCLNHSYKNVVLLCPNCHTLTSTYRALNRGNPKRNKNITYGGRSYKNVIRE